MNLKQCLPTVNKIEGKYQNEAAYGKLKFSDLKKGSKVYHKGFGTGIVVSPDYESAYIDFPKSKNVLIKKIEDLELVNENIIKENIHAQDVVQHLTAAFEALKKLNKTLSDGNLKRATERDIIVLKNRIMFYSNPQIFK